MRDQGLPIDADRGRGGGVRLDRTWGVGRLNLSYPEAVDLLISLAVSEQMNSPMFFANLGSVRRQLIASFSPDKRHKVKGLKARILIGSTASTVVQTTISQTKERPVQALHQAFLDQRTLNIRYQKESGDVSTRTIEPHYLLLNYPVWYVLAFDHLRDAPRAFRCDRVISADVSDDRFRLLPKGYFEQSLEGNDVI
jgi:predicted DNA-binding transcriptional regulator YafY